MKGEKAHSFKDFTNIKKTEQITSGFNQIKKHYFIGGRGNNISNMSSYDLDVSQ